MAETITPRVGLLRWGASTDTPSRVDFNTSLDAIEAKMAIDASGVVAPTPTTAGRWYHDTVTNVFYRDTGTVAIPLASNARDMVVKPSVIGNIPLRVEGIAGQTGNLLEVRSSDAVNYLTVGPTGDINTRLNKISMRANPSANQSVMVITTAGTEHGIELISPDAEVKRMIEVRKTSGAVTFAVEHDGSVISPQVESPLLKASSNSAVAIPLIVKGAAAQTANLQEWRDDAAVVQASMSVAGVASSKKLAITSASSVALDSTNSGIMVGLGTTDNITMNGSRVQARNNNLAANFLINPIGGGVFIGDLALSNEIKLQAVLTTVRGALEVKEAATMKKTLTVDEMTSTVSFKLNTHQVFIQPGAPVAPLPGDIWFPID